jgi:DhnA family fructose-bisphosphate aldolase class Ia
MITVAVDHAPSYGVLPSLEQIQQVVDQVTAARPDAMVMMRGVAQRCFSPHAGHVALMLKCSSLSPYHPGHDVLISSVEDALRLGADAVAMALTVGSEDQPQLLRSLGRLVNRADEVGATRRRTQLSLWRRRAGG